LVGVFTLADENTFARWYRNTTVILPSNFPTHFITNAPTSDTTIATGIMILATTTTVHHLTGGAF
jgi:hypothetical protein